ncbi:MAG: Hsp20/alpha crystallin family protein [Pseudomonadota bacterium]
MNKLTLYNRTHPWGNLMRDMLSDWTDERSDNELSNWTPSADIHETDNAFIIKADIPGVDKNDVDITFDNGVLSINGHRKYKHEEKEAGKVIRSERFEGEFRRSFALPKSIDVEKISAKMSDGVLVITAPKSSETIAKAIKVE